MFEQVTDPVLDQIGHEGATENDLVNDTSFHLRDIFWKDNTIGFTFLILGMFVLIYPCYSLIFHLFFVCMMVVPCKCKEDANR